MPAPPPPTCDAPVTSVCGNPSSVIQGHVRLADGVGPARGDLFLALVHEAYSGAAGGGYHAHTRLRDVDLSEPVPFALDLCLGSAMWTEDNCTYALQVVLDLNGDQSASKLLPDVGEPARKVRRLDLSCRGEAPCLDVVLDCTDGPTCASFRDLSECACEAQTCSSDFALCN